MEFGRISRRHFLYGSAVLAGSVALASCTAGGGGETNNGGGTEGSKAVGSSSEPLAVPGKYQQAPNIDSSLPPVEERLPENPYVIPHSWVQPGKYGGTINMNVFSSTGAATADSDREFFYGHSPLRFLNDGKDVVPGLVESWETNDDASEWTLPLPQGPEVVRRRAVDHRGHHFWWDRHVRATQKHGRDAAGRDALG